MGAHLVALRVLVPRMVRALLTEHATAAQMADAASLDVAC
jgi:hypothetical protein